MFENGFRHIANNARPIDVPADLAGVKLRTPKGEWRVKLFQQYGADPTPMSFSDVFTALETGVIDGRENPYAQIRSAKFQEVQEHLSVTGHVCTPAYVLVSENAFAKLTEDVQADLIGAAAESRKKGYRQAETLEARLGARDTDDRMDRPHIAGVPAGPILKGTRATRTTRSR